MPDWLTMIVLAVVSVVTGGLILRPFLQHAPFSGDWLALLLACVTLGTIAIGLVALILTELGIYSLPLLGGIWLVGVAVFIFIGWRQKVAWWPQIAAPAPAKTTLLLSQRWEKWVLLLWFMAACWLFFRPHQFVHGGADAGVYVNLAAHIHNNGSIIFTDETFANAGRDAQAILSRPISNPVAPAYLLPAFYITDMATGAIEPQFYPFHPVWQAVAYGLGGVDAALMLTGFWTLLSCLAIYLFVRQLWGWETAVIALIALTLCAMQVWFARYPTTETQTQFFLWAGFWGTAVWLRHGEDTGHSVNTPSSLWAFVAGSSLGAVFLVRIDIIFMLPILLAFITWFWATKRKGLVWFGVPLLLLVLHSFVHALTQSRPYFFDLYRFGTRSLVRNQGVLALLIVLGLIGLWLVAKYHQRFADLFVRYRKWLLGTAVIFLLGFALYNWFLRPYNVNLLFWSDQFSGNDIANYNHENLVRLGWYLSPLGVWLGVLGICWLVWRVRWETAVMLTVTIFFTLFYIWNIRNNPHQIYAMRRYVPAVLPLFIVGSAALLDALFQQKQRWRQGIALLLLVSWLGGIIWSARGFVSQVDYAGLPEQLASLSAQFEPNALILFLDDQPVGIGDFVGTPLRFLYGHDAYKLHTSQTPIPPTFADTLQSWQNNGRNIYWIGDPAWLEEHNIPFTTSQITINSRALEGSYTQKPTQIRNIEWVLQINELK